MRFSGLWAPRDSVPAVCTHTASPSKTATAGARLTAGGMTDEVSASCSVVRSGNFRIISLLGLRLPLRCRGLLRRGGLAGLLLAGHGDGAQLLRLDDAAVDQLVHQGAVLLLVLVRQGVLVGAQGDDD